MSAPPTAYTTVELETLCGAKQTLDWYGLPPRAIKVPIRRALSFKQDVLDAMPAYRVRTFQLVPTRSKHPLYVYAEEPEP